MADDKKAKPQAPKEVDLLGEFILKNRHVQHLRADKYHRFGMAFQNAFIKTKEEIAKDLKLKDHSEIDVTHFSANEKYQNLLAKHAHDEILKAVSEAVSLDYKALGNPKDKDYYQSLMLENFTGQTKAQLTKFIKGFAKKAQTIEDLYGNNMVNKMRNSRAYDRLEQGFENYRRGHILEHEETHGKRVTIDKLLKSVGDSGKFIDGGKLTEYEPLLDLGLTTHSKKIANKDYAVSHTDVQEILRENDQITAYKAPEKKKAA